MIMRNTVILVDQIDQLRTSRGTAGNRHRRCHCPARAPCGPDRACRNPRHDPLQGSQLLGPDDDHHYGAVSLLQPS